MVYIFLNLIFSHDLKLNIQDYLLTLLSFNLFALGILSSYISSIFKEVKRRPNYIIKDKIGFN
jgi:hypothetical protein